MVEKGDKIIFKNIFFLLILDRSQEMKILVNQSEQNQNKKYLENKYSTSEIFL
jgi:hypothetical protein